jgi:hypothetical protein
MRRADYIKKLESFLPPPGTAVSCDVGLSYGDFLRQMEKAPTLQHGHQASKTVRRRIGKKAI